MSFSVLLVLAGAWCTGFVCGWLANRSASRSRQLAIAGALYAIGKSRAQAALALHRKRKAATSEAQLDA